MMNPTIKKVFENAARRWHPEMDLTVEKDGFYRMADARLAYRFFCEGATVYMRSDYAQMAFEESIPPRTFMHSVERELESGAA